MIYNDWKGFGKRPSAGFLSGGADAFLTMKRNLAALYQYREEINCPERADEVNNMMNFNSKKTQKIISSVIIILLVLAMVIPTLLSFL